MASLEKVQGGTSPKGGDLAAGIPSVVKTSYTSKPVDIPDSFLSSSTENAPTVTYTKIDFAQTTLPEYAGSYAVVLDNVLTQSECTQLIQLAQLSAGAGDPGVENDGWQPAMVNAGPGVEYLATNYRNSDRIIWDEKTVVQRLWERCLLAKEVWDDLQTIEGKPLVLGEKAVSLGHSWRFTRLNERMRFLRYGKGQFFKEHCDGEYETPNGLERTFYTLHLYLNDSVNTAEVLSRSNSGLVTGGATTFHSVYMQRHLDVDPKAGRVLIFQHRGLLHSGDEVLDGVKYTMRSDLLYAFDETKGSLGWE